MTHPIPRDALKESMAIVGRTGAGKSYAARGAVEVLLDAGERVCIIDPTGVWWGLRSSADGKEPGFPVVVFGGDHADVPLEGSDAAQPLAKLLAEKNLPAIVDVSEFSRSGMVRFMASFLDALYQANRTPLTLVIDEADIFAPQRPEPDTAALLGRMEQIVRRGRVRGFRPWMITQRPASLNKNVLSQANTLIAMQLTAPQDRDAIGAWIEGQADRDEGKKVLAELPKLKKGEGWIWSPSHDVLSRARFPAIATYDSSRTPEAGEDLPAIKLAEVDLEAISESLRPPPKEAAADDDAEALRARIAELEEATRSRPDTTMLLADAHRRGQIHGYGEAITALVPMIDRMQTLRIALDEQLGGLVEDLGKWRAKYASDQPVHSQNCNSASVYSESIHEPPTAPPVKHSGQFANPRTSPVSASPGSLSKAERLILTALAQYQNGRSKVQVAILTGYAVGGGGFSNAVSSLRTRGLLEGDSNRLIITPGGMKELGPFKPLPRGRALLDHWLGQLGKAERKALEALAEVHPRTLTKPQLANRAGYEANGGGFNNALSRLRTLELVQGRAEIKASDALF